MILLDQNLTLQITTCFQVFYLNYDENEGARIYVIVNKHKMYLDKMSIQLKMEFSASI
jgi:hypothetical protein